MKNFNLKRWVLLIAVVLMTFAPLFAQSGGSEITALNTFGDSVIAMMKSKWVKVAFALAFILEGVGLVFSYQAGSPIFKRFMGAGIGTLVAAVSLGIVNWVFDSFLVEDITGGLSPTQKIEQLAESNPTPSFDMFDNV